MLMANSLLLYKNNKFVAIMNITSIRIENYILHMFEIKSSAKIFIIICNVIINLNRFFLR